MKKVFLILVIFFFNFKVFSNDKMLVGADIFNNKAMCGSCHALQAAGSESNIGPNLDMLKPQIDQIVYTVTNGIGVMPAWGDVLTIDEIEAVAYYVFTSTSK